MTQLIRRHSRFHLRGRTSDKPESLPMPVPRDKAIELAKSLLALFVPAEIREKRQMTNPLTNNLCARLARIQEFRPRQNREPMEPEFDDSASSKVLHAAELIEQQLKNAERAGFASAINYLRERERYLWE